MYKQLRARTYEIVESAGEGDIQSKIFDITIMALVVLNIFSVIIDTVPSIHQSYGTYFEYFETVSVAVFTIEYLLRLWSCTSSHKFSRPITGRIRHMFTFMALIDLLAILPFYLAFIPVDLRAIRILRLFRIFRIAKLGRYNNGIGVLKRVIMDKREELTLTIAAMFCLLIISSSIMYFLEHEAQPEAFSSIPATMWWGVCTLTTVGYGDLYPVTMLGKLLASFISILGIGMFALPAGILASGFETSLLKQVAEHPPTEEVSTEHAAEGEHKEKCFCPYCGGNLKE